MTHSTRTGFVPTSHGFPFPNWFPPGTPVITIPTPFGPWHMGDANRGLCGGMIFSAIDLYLTGQSRPAEADPPLFRYFARRLLQSWNLPFGVLKYYDWQRRPNRCRYLAGVRVTQGVARLTIEEEWPRIRAVLDTGLPAALGLVKVHSLSPNPYTIAQNHQVLAYGYDLDEAVGMLTLWTYDPNYPNDDDLTLRIDLRDPDAGRPVIHGVEGPTVRGLFLTEYRRPIEVPPLGTLPG